ncbi:hypothetical protein [Novosphingobium ovatum]|uniref:hypothetical protein n=1 Tax=Novosphingobium ovatum TaxID=1908523 RepID=UPI001D0F56FA|nr:hypothetical protein [Novosphingobium ovatum]
MADLAKIASDHRRATMAPISNQRPCLSAGAIVMETQKAYRAKPFRSLTGQAVVFCDRLFAIVTYDVCHDDSYLRPAVLRGAETDRSQGTTYAQKDQA